MCFCANVNAGLGPSHFGKITCFPGAPPRIKQTGVDINEGESLSGLLWGH